MYHLLFFTSINPAAYGFGIICIIQGLLFCGLEELTIKFCLTDSSICAASPQACWYSMPNHLSYNWLFAWTHLPAIADIRSACPTTIFTFGILLWLVHHFRDTCWLFRPLVGCRFQCCPQFRYKRRFWFACSRITGTVLLLIRKKQDANRWSGVWAVLVDGGRNKVCGRKTTLNWWRICTGLYHFWSEIERFYMSQLVPVETIQNHIFLVRGKKVMLNTHLADCMELKRGYWCRR